MPALELALTGSEMRHCVDSKITAETADLSRRIVFGGGSEKEWQPTGLRNSINLGGRWLVVAPCCLRQQFARAQARMKRGAIQRVASPCYRLWIMGRIPVNGEAGAICVRKKQEFCRF